MTPMMITVMIIIMEANVKRPSSQEFPNFVDRHVSQTLSFKTFKHHPTEEHYLAGNRLKCVRFSVYDISADSTIGAIRNMSICEHFIEISTGNT